jgi:hypothetical protein
MLLGIIIWYPTWILRYFTVPAMIILLQIEHFVTMPIQESQTSATIPHKEYHWILFEYFGTQINEMPITRHKR